jgi:hypothetical protein
MTHAGVFINHDSIVVGQLGIVSCVSDIETTPGTIMEWLHNEDITESATSTNQLDLVFSPVSDAIHGQMYVCRVTGENGEHAEKKFTVKVDGIIN